MKETYSRSINKEGIIIKGFDEKYVDQYVDFANETFGENYIDKKTLLKHVNCENEMCTLAIEESSNRLIGFCIFYVETPKEIIKNCIFTRKELDMLRTDKKNICHIHSIAVKKEYQKSGISFELFESTLSKAKKLGFTFGFAIAWKRKDFIPAKKILINHGFIKLKTLSMPWYNNKTYSCIDCNGPCKCDGVVYYKSF